MARFHHLLLSAACATLLCGCTEAGFAQDAHVVSAGSADVDAEGEDSYRWIDRARALWDTVGDAPPDYSFGFDGGTPVAWELRDGYWVVVEERAEGARTYFFAPGDRGPFLVREADRSFGYQDGNVAAVYDGGGRLTPRSAGVRDIDTGERLYDRGRRLRNALLDRQWAPVDTTAWGNLNLFFVGIDPGWDSGWRYRNDGFAFAEQRRWAEERARRAAMAAAFARWRSGGFQGPPPPGLGQHWQHRPRPGRPPNAGTPPGTVQPGRPWMWGGLPGQRPDRPQGTRPPSPPPSAGTPGRHEWEAGGAIAPRPDGVGARPPRGDGQGRPGWQGPRPGWQGARPGGPGPRPDAGAPQPAPPPAAAASPPPTAPAEAAPRRGGWMSPGWMRQARPDASGEGTPRPVFRPPSARPEGMPNRPAPAPAAPPPLPAARPAPAPAARPAPAPEMRRPSPVARAHEEARTD